MTQKKRAGSSKKPASMGKPKGKIVSKTTPKGTTRPRRVLAKSAKPLAKAQKKIPILARAARPQLAAARNTNGNYSPEEQIERSKFDVGVPTKDLSVKIPKALPSGYGKDRIVVMVRDPFWIHCYWESTRQSAQRAEAALAQDWYGATPILRILAVT